MWCLTMKFSLCFRTLLTILFVLISGCWGEDAGKPIYVAVLFRHGQRNPSSFYLNDPYKALSYWPEGLSQLTNTGKTQEYDLGKFLRQRYDTLLGELYDFKKLYVESTDADRTLMSAQCVLAGMFPPKGKDVWSTRLKWQPIPVHTRPSNLDNTFSGFAPCPAYDADRTRLLQSAEVRETDKKYRNLYKVLNDHTGEYVQNLQTIFDIYTTLFKEEERNYTLPSWTKDVYPHPMYEAACLSFIQLTKTKKMKRFKAGLVINTVVDEMTSRLKGGSRSFHVYSGHEHTVAAVMRGLDIFFPHTPPYAACLMMELRQTEAKEHVVTIHYRNSTAEPGLLTIPGCTSACPLKKFIELTKPIAITPKEWNIECRRRNSGEGKK